MDPAHGVMNLFLLMMIMMICVAPFTIVMLILSSMVKTTRRTYSKITK